MTTLVFGWYSATRIRDNKTPTQSKEHIYANTAHGLACTTYSILVSVGSCDCPPIACTCDAVGLVSSDTGHIITIPLKKETYSTYSFVMKKNVMNAQLSPWYTISWLYSDWQ